MSDSNYSNKYELIEKERLGYVKINKKLLEECKQNKKMLDMHYADLYCYIVYIQTSVIIFSTISAFIQALASQITISSETQFVVSLIISSYTSLVLSLSKFYKLDERKENVNYLREKFSEIQQQITYRLDTLRPWEAPGFVNKDNIDERINDWNTDRGFIRTDYFEVIKNKEKLFMEFEKLIDSKMRNKYLLSYKQEETEYIQEIDKLNGIIGSMDGQEETSKLIIENVNQNL